MGERFLKVVAIGHSVISEVYGGTVMKVVGFDGNTAICEWKTPAGEDRTGKWATDLLKIVG